MSDPIALRDATLELLRAVPNITVYDQDVEDAPPADTHGFVLPYLVLWGNPGRTPADAYNAAADADDGRVWTAKVTAAGGDLTRCLQAAALARGALVGVRPVAGASKFVEDDIAIDAALDRDVTPPRTFVPLFFTTRLP